MHVLVMYGIFEFLQGMEYAISCQENKFLQVAVKGGVYASP